MSKKRGKSAAGSASGTKWESAIVSSSLSEESWNMSISLLVGNKIEDKDIIDFLINGVATGQRRLFNVVSKTELIKLVTELGNPKVKKGKEVPANYEVCEAAKPYLDANEDIPLPLMAKLIKFKLLDLKTADQKRREGEKKGTEKGGKKKEKSAGKERGKSAKKGGKKTPEPPSVKNESKLRKRGEEDPDAKYIDDEPDDGAQKYVILTGFDHPQLLSYLANIGVRLDSIIKIRAQDYDIWQQKMNSIPEPNTASAAVVNEEEKKLQECKARIQLIKFWRDVTMILRQHGNLKDITLMEYEVKQLLYPVDMEDNDKKLEFSMHLFEDIACLMYDLLDARRQWLNYLSQTHLLQVPEEIVPTSPKSEASATGTEEGALVDMRYYNDVLAGLSSETISVDTIVHAMLDQVEATEQDKTPPSECPPPIRPDHVDSGLAAHLAKLALRLPLSAAEARKLEVELLPKMSKDLVTQRMTMLLHPCDDIGRRSLSLKPTETIDLKKAEEELLFKMEPYSNLLRFPPLSTELARKRAARLQEMINFCSGTELTREEVDRAFKQFVFENLQLTCTDPTGYVLQPHFEDIHKVNHLWDDPYPFFKTMKDIADSEIAPPRASSRRSNSVTDRPRSRTPEPPGSSDGSRPASGILKRSASSSPSRSRKSSVHFESEALLKSVRDCPPVNKAPMKDNEEVMHELEIMQQRQLDEWCFAEHLQSHVFLQVLKAATHQLPYIDTYYHRRDHTLLVVLHNPFNPEMMSNHVQWQHWLHADIGFRNYLDHVSVSIREWTNEQEAIYEADQLRKEVETNLKEDEDAKKKEASGRKRERSKSPKKGGKGARSRSGSRGSSAERSDNENFLIRDNSLKAQKIEMEKILREKEEEERKKQEKRARSAEKRAAKEASEKAAKEKRPGSKGSAKSRKSRSPSAEAPKDQQKQEEEPKEPEPYWPFVGYNLGDDIVHVSGEITTMFPVDGGTIRTERTDFVQGNIHVRTCVLKDGHVFTIHVQDPVREVTSHVDMLNAEISQIQQRQKMIEEAMQGLPEPVEDVEVAEGEKAAVESQPQIAEEQPPRPASFFGSFSARFNDGLCLALSAFGDEGRPSTLQKPTPEVYTPPATRPASTDVKEGGGKGRGRGKDKSPTPAAPQESARDEIDPTASGETMDGGSGGVEMDMVDDASQKFQKLFLSSPDGSSIQFLLESQAGALPGQLESGGSDKRLLLRIRRAGEEVSRLITCEGTVLRILRNGHSQILYPDGTVAECVGNEKSEAVPPTDTSPRQQRVGTGRSQRGGAGDDSPSRKSQKSQKSGNTEGGNVEPVVNGDAVECSVPVWQITAPSGVRTNTVGGRLLPLMLTRAVDPSTGQEVYTRADRTTMVQWPEADSCVVEHADGTRITQFGLWQAMAPTIDGETGEESGPAQMEVQRFVRVECPGSPSVLINIVTGEMETRFGRDGGNVLLASPLGVYHLHHSDGGQMTIHEDGTCLYTGRPTEPETAFLQSDGLPTYAMRHNGDVVCEVVDPDGNLFSVDTGGSSHVMLARGECEEETAEASPTKSSAQIRRFSQHAPRFFIIHPDSCATELLRYQDVAGYISSAEKDPEAAVIREDLHDCPHMTGISVLRPIKYDITQKWRSTYVKDSIYPPGLTSRDLKTLPPTEFKKPGPKFGSNVGRGLAIGSAVRHEPQPTAPKCPKELEFRQFVQYNPIQNETREILRDRMRKFAEYIQSRDEKIESSAVMDPRSEEEKLLASQLLARAATVRANLQIDDVENLYEKATAPPPPPAPPTPQPKRTAADWERDRLALLEEKQNRDALRNKYVPNYFRSDFGKDFVLSQATSVKSFSKQMNVFPNSVQASAHKSPPVTLTVEDGESKTRPVNPTPGQALANTSPKSTRPMNPTPGHGVIPVPRPDGPTPKHAVNEFAYFDTNHSVDPSPVATVPPPASVCVDVTGEARKSEVEIPNYLNAGRPGRQGHNVRQAAIEDPVRRRILTSSVVGGSLASQLGVRRMRGLDILPTRVDFGLLREGFTYRHKVLLKNTGVETCRFKFRQPPPATGIRLFFRPGPIPPGLSSQVIVEVYAIAAGVESGQSGVGLVEHNLQVITETDVMQLPIALRVMTAHEYDQQQDVSIAKGVELIAKGSIARDGIIRPRRSLDVM